MDGLCAIACAPPSDASCTLFSAREVQSIEYACPWPWLDAQLVAMFADYFSTSLLRARNLQLVVNVVVEAKLAP